MQFCSIQDPGYVKRRQVQQENFMEHNNNNNNNRINVTQKLQSHLSWEDKNIRCVIKRGLQRRTDTTRCEFCWQ